MGIRLTPVVIRSRAGRWALSVLAILWAVAGWWIVVDGSLMLSNSKYSRNAALIDGGQALFMALVFLSLSTVAAAVVLQSLQASRLWYRLLLCANLGLPVAAWFALH
ncbi:hypothetical protein AB6Q56_15400 [Dechloromonas sp. ARDL1]|uniref:hypothetical protein n=1 Tax=Dechloromonas sp. ARDL1 TaxID=3322121 RepID=UPI003DA70BE7